MQGLFVPSSAPVAGVPAQAIEPSMNSSSPRTACIALLQVASATSGRLAFFSFVERVASSAPEVRPQP